MDAGTAEPAEILQDEITRQPAVRRALHVEVAADALAVVEQRLDAERGRVGRFFGLTLTRREGPGFLRYPAGAFYRPHRDRGTVPSWPAAAQRRIALVIFLNSSAGATAPSTFTGGALRLLEPAPYEILPTEGTCVAFSADLLHEVAPVVDGVRDSIVDWYY